MKPILVFILPGWLLVACSSERPPSPDRPLDEVSSLVPRIVRYEVHLHQGNNNLVLQGAIDHNEQRITLPAPNQRWIRDIAEGVVTFDVTSATCSVLVGDTPQVSGSTRNDFRQDLVYALVNEAGDTTTYTVVTFDAPQTTGLPVVHVDTRGTAITTKTTYVPCTISVADPSDPANDREISVTGDGIRLRGNTTMYYDKKPYRLKLDKKGGFFGLGEAKSWVLLANYLDPTLITNTVAFEIGRRFAGQRQGSAPFVNSAWHVELFIGDSYEGSYLFTEQVQVNEYRVNIDEDDDYLLELDSYYDEDNKFRIAMYPPTGGDRDLPVNIQSPEDEAGAVALPAIQAEMQLLVDRLTNNRAFDRPDDRYRDLIDMTSTVDFIMINEIVGNQELQHPKSTYMYKRKGGRWEFGPLWDFDWGFGYSGSGFSYFSSGYVNRFLFNASTSFTGDPRAGNVFFAQFFRDPVFRAAYKARWNEMKAHFSTINEFIITMGGNLARSAAQNKTRWSQYYATIHHANQIANMASFMTNRISYLDGKINEASW